MGPLIQWFSVLAAHSNQGDIVLVHLLMLGPHLSPTRPESLGENLGQYRYSFMVTAYSFPDDSHL